MLELAYEANISENIEKKKDIQEKILSRIMYIDFLINLCYDKKIINGKKYLKFGEDLNYLSKYVYGWKKYINEEEGIAVRTSRNVNSNSSNCNFNVRNVNTSGDLNNNNLCNVNSDGDTNGNANENGLRPCSS